MNTQYLIQLIENQPKLLDYCRELGRHSSLAETVEYDSSRGLVCTREAHLHQRDSSNIANRWNRSGLRTRIVMNREPYNKATQEISSDTSGFIHTLLDMHAGSLLARLAYLVR